MTFYQKYVSMYTYILCFERRSKLLAKNSKSPYGQVLVDLIKKSGMSQGEFYEKLNIRKPYFYDIICGKTNPPPPEKQLEIIKILEPKKEDREKLLYEASKARSEIPADILIFLLSHPEYYSKLRDDISVF